MDLVRNFPFCIYHKLLVGVVYNTHLVTGEDIYTQVSSNFLGMLSGQPFVIPNLDKNHLSLVLLQLPHLAKRRLPKLSFAWIWTLATAAVVEMTVVSFDKMLFTQYPGVRQQDGIHAEVSSLHLVCLLITPLTCPRLFYTVWTFVLKAPAGKDQNCRSWERH